MSMTFKERLAKAIEFNKQFVASKKAAQIATIDLIKTDTLSADEINELVDIYPYYVIGKHYGIGNIFQYEDKLYKVVQAHTSQSDWIPSSTPALYTPVIPIGTVAEFIQPTGAQDAYNIGDRVLFKGLIYESIINANVWSPTAYPQGWILSE